MLHSKQCRIALQSGKPCKWKTGGWWPWWAQLFHQPMSHEKSTANHHIGCIQPRLHLLPTACALKSWLLVILFQQRLPRCLLKLLWCSKAHFFSIHLTSSISWKKKKRCQQHAGHGQGALPLQTSLHHGCWATNRVASNAWMHVRVRKLNALNWYLVWAAAFGGKSCAVKHGGDQAGCTCDKLKTWALPSCLKSRNC